MDIFLNSNVCRGALALPWFSCSPPAEAAPPPLAGHLPESALANTSVLISVPFSLCQRVGQLLHCSEPSSFHLTMHLGKFQTIIEIYAVIFSWQQFPIIWIYYNLLKSPIDGLLVCLSTFAPTAFLELGCQSYQIKIQSSQLNLNFR